MHLIPIQRARERKPAHRQPRSDRTPPRAEERRCPSDRVLPGRLRVERGAAGTAVTGPTFYIWDTDHETALRWAQQLARVLRICEVGGSRPSGDR